MPKHPISYFQIEKSMTKPGYVKINMNFLRNKKDPTKAEVLKEICPLLDHNGFICKSKILKWFELLLDNFFRTLNKPGKSQYELLCNGNKYLVCFLLFTYMCLNI